MATGVYVSWVRFEAPESSGSTQVRVSWARLDVPVSSEQEQPQIVEQQFFGPGTRKKILPPVPPQEIRTRVIEPVVPSDEPTPELPVVVPVEVLPEREVDLGRFVAPSVSRIEVAEPKYEPTVTGGESFEVIVQTDIPLDELTDEELLAIYEYMRWP